MKRILDILFLPIGLIAVVFYMTYLGLCDFTRDRNTIKNGGYLEGEQ